MKKTALFIFTILFALHTHAQDPDLFEHTWYLQKVVIDEEEHFIDEYTEHIATTEFSEEEKYIHVYLCEFYDFFATHSFDTSTPVFELSELEENPFPSGCSNDTPELSQYRDLYFSIFYDWDHEPPPFLNPFTYTLETEDDTQMLTIENTNGDYAVYNNQELSVSSFEAVSFSVYPNPTNEMLHITNSGQAQKACIYSITGQKVTEHKDSFSEINVRHLQNGVYFLVLESPEGEKQTHRFIKE